MSERRNAPVARTDVLVVGGGLAGLTAGACLARAGLGVRVQERAAELGGRARTIERGGFLLNMGPHALYRNGGAARVLAELGVEWSGSEPPLDGNLLTAGGRRWTLPVGALALLRHPPFSWRDRLAALAFFARLPRVDPDSIAGISLDEWLGRQGLSDKLAARIRSFVRLTSYCADSARVSAGAVVAQLQQATSGGVIYLDGGWRTLVEGLTRCARNAGAELHTSASVRAVTPAHGGIEAELEDGSRVRASSAVLALSPDAAPQVLGDAAGRRLRAFAEAAEPVRAACLDVGLARLPRPEVTFALDLEEPLYMSVHSASARLAPRGGHLVQLACYGGDPDGTARDRLSEWLDDLQPGWRSHVAVQRYLPRPAVMNHLPRAADGGLAGRPAPQDSGCPGVYLCGDWVGDAGLLSDASLVSAQRAAREIASVAGRSAA